MGVKLEDIVLDFGKYKGKSILEVAKIDKHYLDWLLSKTKILGPGELLRSSINYFFPFELMKKYGYYPSKQIVKAYKKREKELEELNLKISQHEDDMARYEEERGLLREMDNEFREDMGSDGYWNLDR